MQLCKHLKLRYKLYLNDVIIKITQWHRKCKTQHYQVHYPLYWTIIRYANIRLPLISASLWLWRELQKQLWICEPLLGRLPQFHHHLSDFVYKALLNPGQAFDARVVVMFPVYNIRSNHIAPNFYRDNFTTH